MKTLQLTIKKHWFELILSGRKAIEYRERKAHWISRIEKEGVLVDFDNVVFINGYGADKPYIKMAIQKIAVAPGRKTGANNEILSSDYYYEIHLGEALEVGNLTR